MCASKLSCQDNSQAGGILMDCDGLGGRAAMVSLPWWWRRAICLIVHVLHATACDGRGA